MTTLQPDIAAAFDELDRRDKARESEVRADPMVAAAFSTTDPMRMSPERLAKDRARGMGRQPTVPRQETLESWDDWVDRTYGLTPVVRYGMDTGRRLLRPETGTEVATRNAAVGAARTAIGRRDAGLAGMGRTQVNAPTGDPMAPVVPSTTFLGKSWDSVVSGLETTQDSLNGLAALAYNLDPARRMIAQATGNRMVRQMSDYSRFVAEDVAAASPKSDSFIGQAYYGAVSSLPNLALQVGTSAIAGPAGFIVTGVGADAGSTYAQSTVENTDALLAANPGMDRQTASRIASESATVDAAISGAVSAATNYLPAKVLGTKPELRGLRGFALAKHIGRKASGGAAAEGTQEFTQQVATDMAIAMHRMNQPEFARYFAENPDWWVKVIEDGAMAAMSGAMAGGAVGAGHGAVATLESEVRRSIPVDRKPTPTDAREWVGRVASHEDEVVAGFSRDTAFQRAVGEGLDLGGITTEELAKVAGGDVSAGHTASLLGGLLEGRRFVVTPAMAADEIVRRSGEGKSRIVGGTMAMSGPTPTEDEVADWKARNPEMSAKMAAAGSLTRQMAVRILGREFEGNSREFRENLHSMIRSVEPRKSDAELTAERIAADLVGIPADQAMLVLRGLSPESAGIAARIKAEEAAKGPVGGGAVESALSQIAAVNGLQREDIAELTELEPDDLAVADFADKRGYKVRFFATRERVPTRGALVDGTIWLSADLSGPEARHAVAIHEIADSIHGSDPRLWGELEAAIRSVAPEALESAGRTYGLRYSEQGGQTLTDADLARESVSTTLEALVEAYSLHLAVGPDGSFDVAKARKLVGENPSAMARFVAAIRSLLRSLGVRLADDAATRRMSQFMGGSPSELSNPNVRAFIAQQLGKMLAEHRKIGGTAPVIQSVGKPEGQRNQRRIDLAFQMGRRSGLVAGQVEGQKAARKVAAAEKRAALRHQRDEMVLAARKARTELMDRIRSLRESIALKPTEAAVRRKTTKDIKALLADATKEVERLPKSWRGKFARRLSKATTKARMLRLAEDVAKDLALVPVQALRSDIVRMSRRVGKAKARAETKEVAKKAYSDALAMLSSPSGRRMQYTSDADIANRVAAATLLMDSAMSALVADSLYARSAKVQRATQNAALTAELRKSLLAMRPIKDDGDPTKPPRSALATFVTTPSSDIHTIAHAIEGSGGGAMARIVAGLQHGEEAMNLEKSEVRKAVERAIGPMFRNRHEYDRLAAGVNGEASVRMVPVLLGGKRTRIPLGLAMSLAAQDAPSVERMAKVGFVWRSNMKGKPIVPRAAEFDALRRKYGPVVDAVKKAVGDRLADRYFDEYFRLNGQTAPRVDGYYATSRRDDPSADVVDPASIQTGAAVGNALFRQSGDQIARVDSPRPFVIGDFLQTMDRTIDGQLRFIHMAERGREAARVILNADTQTLLDSRFGDGMGESLKLWLLNGLGLSRSHQVGLDAAVSSMSGAMILLNLRTWARQLGGIPKAMTDIDPASLARGVAAASRDIASPSAFRKAVDSVMRNGYFLERWESSQVGRMAGLEGGRKADRARAGAAIRGAFASLAESLRSGATGRIAESGRALGQALAQATLATRAVEWPIRLIDQMVALSVIRGYEASGMSHDQAIAAAAQAFRRTQNPSSRLDDTMLMARAKTLGGRWGAAKLLFPFSGDVAKGFNQAARAWRGGTTRERARTFAALAANSAWSAAVNPMFVAAALALKYALGDEDDEAIESANREAMAREFGTDLMARAAADLIAYNAGYVGLLGGAVAESIIKGREPDIGELAVPVRLANDIIGAVSSGDPWKAGKSALTAAGVPQVQLVNLAESLNRSVSPDDERAIELLSARKRDGTATRAQLRKLAELTARREAAYAKAKAAGEPQDEYQSRRMERDRKRIEARMRQRETLDNEPSP